MKQFMLLFTVGKDRPGIVNDVSTLLFQHGANIEDSRMAVLGGRFAIITLFSASPRDLEKIRTAIGDLQQLGLEAFLYDAEDPGASRRMPSLPLYVEIRAIDHPGIVKRVVQILHRHNANIQSLKTDVNRAPLSGAPLLELYLEADVPAEAPIAGIKEALGALAVEMNLDLSFIRNPV
ncbi:MAG: ACT domain-containing protein [Thermodesulfobacteriota bacterium]